MRQWPDLQTVLPEIRPVSMVCTGTHYRDRRFAGAILVSDCESWVSQGRSWAAGPRGATGVMAEWQKFVKNQLRLSDMTSRRRSWSASTSRLMRRRRRRIAATSLNVGGFSDAVFQVVSAFLASDASRFVAEVEAVTL
jgi:60 kDa SS-A/Ro ribonucleoprotein